MSVSCRGDLSTLSRSMLEDAISPMPTVPSLKTRARPRVRSRLSVTLRAAFSRWFASLTLFSALAPRRVSSSLLWAVRHVVSNLPAVVACDWAFSSTFSLLVVLVGLNVRQRLIDLRSCPKIRHRLPLLVHTHFPTIPFQRLETNQGLRRFWTFASCTGRVLERSLADASAGSITWSPRRILVSTSR